MGYQQVKDDADIAKGSNPSPQIENTGKPPARNTIDVLPEKSWDGGKGKKVQGQIKIINEI